MAAKSRIVELLREIAALIEADQLENVSLRRILHNQVTGRESGEVDIHLRGESLVMHFGDPRFANDANLIDHLKVKQDAKNDPM